MSNIVAGIGRGQLVYLNNHIQKKKQIYEMYREAFKDLPLQMNPHLEDSEPNYWLSCMLIDRDCSVAPNKIRERLEQENIESRPIWKPMHLQPVFQDNYFITAEKNNDVGGDIFSRGLCLPSDIKLGEEELDRVVEIVKGCF
jgi:dTDP-4-amino-4,6-dideoxygalactose transaminase